VCPVGRRTRRAEGMNTPLDFSAPVLSRSVDLTNAQDSWLARSHTLGAPSSSPHRNFLLTPSPDGAIASLS